jgi:hypothetical protein
MPTVSHSLRPGSMADSGTGPAPSLAREGGCSPAAADLSFVTLVSRASMLLAASIGQGALVSRLPATSGAASGSEALVSHSLAASMFSGSLTCSALAQLLSISPLLQVLITLQVCLFTVLPLDWTHVLRPRHMQLAWNTPGRLASPSSLVEFGDQSDLKRLPPAFVSPLLCSSLRNVVNADLFFLAE